MKPHPGNPPMNHKSRFKSRLRARALRPHVSLLITLLALACTLPGVTRADTLVVTTTADNGAETLVPGSLREALFLAFDGDTIDAAGITGTVTLVAGPNSLAELRVFSNITILGPGPDKL